MKKIAVGDLGEFWYGDYKEPFEQLEGAVPGHPVGVVLKADDGKLLCPFCGKTYEHLGAHAHRAHGLSAKEYKREVGLPQGSALCSERIRFKRIAVATRAGLGKDRTREHAMVAQALSAGPRRTAEHDNKTGRCYSQVLVVARMLASQRRLNLRTLSQHGISRFVVARWFGDLNTLKRMLGQPEAIGRYRLSDTEMLNGLRAVAMELGHTPTRSDLRRFGVPGHLTYRRRFGSYSEACRKAGLDSRLLPISDDERVTILTAYATTGSVTETARAAHRKETRVRQVLADFGYPFPAHYAGSGRREWAAEMARRLAGTTEQAA